MDRYFMGSCSTPAGEKRINPDESLPFSEITTTAKKRCTKVRTHKCKRTTVRSRNGNYTESSSDWETDTEEFESKIICENQPMEKRQEEDCSDIQIEGNKKTPVIEKWPTPECVRDGNAASEQDLNISFRDHVVLYESICHHGYESEAKMLSEEISRTVYTPSNRKTPEIEEWPTPECVRDDNAAPELDLNISFPDPSILNKSIYHDGYESEGQIFSEEVLSTANTPKILRNDGISNSVLNQSRLHDFKKNPETKRRKDVLPNIRTYTTLKKNSIIKGTVFKRTKVKSSQLESDRSCDGQGEKSSNESMDQMGSNGNISSYHSHPQWSIRSEQLWDNFIKECHSQNTNKDNVKVSFSKGNFVTLNSSSDEFEEIKTLENVTGAKTLDASNHKADVKNATTNLTFSKGKRKTNPRNVSSEVSKDQKVRLIRRIKRLPASKVNDESASWNTSEMLISDSEDDEKEKRRLPAASTSSGSVARKKTGVLKVDKRSRKLTKEPCYSSVTTTHVSDEEYKFNWTSDSPIKHEMQQTRKHRRMNNNNHTFSSRNVGIETKKIPRKTMKRDNEETVCSYTNDNSAADAEGPKDIKPKQRTTDASKYIVGIDWGSEWSEMNENGDPEIDSTSEVKNCPETMVSSESGTTNKYDSIPQLNVDCFESNAVSSDSSNITLRKYKHLRNNEEIRLEPTKEYSLLSDIENNLDDESLSDKIYTTTSEDKSKYYDRKNRPNKIEAEKNTEVCVTDSKMFPRASQKHDKQKYSVLQEANRSGSKVMEANRNPNLGDVTKLKKKSTIKSIEIVHLNYKIIKKNP